MRTAIACICGAPMAMADATREFRCTRPSTPGYDMHTSPITEQEAADKRLGPFAPRPPQYERPTTTISYRYGQTTGLEVARPDLFP